MAPIKPAVAHSLPPSAVAIAKPQTKPKMSSMVETAFSHLGLSNGMMYESRRQQGTEHVVDATMRGIAGLHGVTNLRREQNQLVGTFELGVGYPFPVEASAGYSANLRVNFDVTGDRFTRAGPLAFAQSSYDTASIHSVYLSNPSVGPVVGFAGTRAEYRKLFQETGFAVPTSRVDGETLKGRDSYLIDLGPVVPVGRGFRGGTRVMTLDFDANDKLVGLGVSETDGFKKPAQAPKNTAGGSAY